MALHVQLEQFEGPLGLLLYLIRKEEMDIYDIPIHRITGQYLDHIRHIREIDIEAAGDFVAMAATLIQIKARMLLPQYDEQGEEVVDEDPRKELVRRLVEYQKFQTLAKELDGRVLLHRDVFPRGLTDSSFFDEPLAEDRRDDIELDEGGLFRMIQLYKTALKKFSQRVHTVVQRTQSVAARILEIRHLFAPGLRVSFFEVLNQADRNKHKVLITFLSVLEMTRLGFLKIFQAEPYSDIHMDCLRSIESDVVSRVEEFETPSDQLAQTSNLLANVAEPLPEPLEVGGETVVQAEQLELRSLGDESEMATDEDLILAEEQLGFREPLEELEELKERPGEAVMDV